MAESSVSVAEQSVSINASENTVGTGSASETTESRVAKSVDATSTTQDVLTDDETNINHLSRIMFDKTAQYLDGELAATLDDYKMLEEMNKITTTKYSDMKQIAANVSRALKELNEKYKSLQPYLDQIDVVEASALKLEQAAYKLDAYSKRLEAKFKQLEKR